MVYIPKVKFLESCLATIDCYLFIIIHFIHNFALVMSGRVLLIQSVCRMLSFKLNSDRISPHILFNLFIISFSWICSILTGVSQF